MQLITFFFPFMVTVTIITSMPAKPLPGTVIIINGVSSSGKTSTAKALQQLFTHKNIHNMFIPSDEILLMGPKEWIPWLNDSSTINPDALRFLKKEDGTLQIAVGTFIEHMFEGLFESLKAFANCGITVICDAALPSENILAIAATLKNEKAYFVGITCSPEVTQKRERERAGIIGLSQAQLEQIKPHAHGIYDIMIDTTNVSPQQAAEQIMQLVETAKPSAFKKLYNLQQPSLWQRIKAFFSSK